MADITRMDDDCVGLLNAHAQFLARISMDRLLELDTAILTATVSTLLHVIHNIGEHKHAKAIEGSLIKYGTLQSMAEHSVRMLARTQVDNAKLRQELQEAKGGDAK